MEDDVHSRLGRIEGKLDMLIDRENKQEDRLHSVEKKVWLGSGIAVIASAVLAKFGIPFPH